MRSHVVVTRRLAVLFTLPQVVSKVVPYDCRQQCRNMQCIFTFNCKYWVGLVPYSNAVPTAAVERIGAAKAGRTFVTSVNGIAPIFLENLKKIFTERVRKNILISGVNTFLSVLSTFPARFRCHFCTNDLHVMMFNIWDSTEYRRKEGRSAFVCAGMKLQLDACREADWHFERKEGLGKV